MKFSFQDEQLLFAEATREMLKKDCTPEAINKFVKSDSTTMPELWNAFASMGVLGMAASEALGGLEMADQDFVLIMEELGRAACPEPVMEHAALSIPLMEECNNENQYTSILESAINGEQRLSVALEGQYVLGADSADYLLLFRDGLLHLVDKESVDLKRQTSVDSSRRLFSVIWDISANTVIEGDSDKVQSLIEKTKLRAGVSTAAQCIGVAQQLLDMTVEYVRERRQFGKPVGVNQAIKHHLADTGKAIEFARPMVYRAAWSLNKDDTEPELATHMAKLLASKAVDLACKTSLQCHGAIAYTLEYDLQIWLKRGLTLSSSWGDIYSQRERIADCLGL